MPRDSLPRLLSNRTTSLQLKVKELGSPLGCLELLTKGCSLIVIDKSLIELMDHITETKDTASHRDDIC